MSVRHSKNQAEIVSIDVDASGVSCKIYVISETGAFVTAARLRLPFPLVKQWLREIDQLQKEHCQGTLPWD